MNVFKTNEGKMLKIISTFYTLINVCLILIFSTNTNAAATDDFVTTWVTDNSGASNDTSIQIRTNSFLTYSYNVDWNNDEIFDEFNITGDITHDFGTAGTYTIRISGDFPQLYFLNQGDKDKIVSIDQWGTFAWQRMNNSFHGASNVVNKAIDTPNLSTCFNMSLMFQGATSIGGVGDTGDWNWNTGNISNFIHVFFQAASFNKDISNWNTISATNMAGMFFQASSFNQNLALWNFENVGNFVDFLQSSGLDFVNYDALLISLSNQNINSSLTFEAGGVKYCSQDALNARSSLMSNFSWTIQDSGREPSCNPTPDLKVQITNYPTSVLAGELIEYSINIQNIGSQDVVNATFSDILPIELITSQWTCTTSNINTCSSAGTGQINDTISIASESSIFYTVTATVTNNSFTEVHYQAQATINPNQIESDYSNNYSSDLNVNGDIIYRNSFEQPVVVLKNNETEISYDFSKIEMTQLNHYPKQIIQRTNKFNQSNLWIHVRKLGDQLQIRMSYKENNIWVIGKWQDIINKTLTTLYF